MIKRIFKTLGVLTFFGISLVSLYLVNLFYMKPASIDHYLAKEVITDLVDSPEAMTYMGVFDGLNWLTNHNAKLSIPKSDDLKKDIQNARKRLNILNKYNDESLNDGQRITKKIAIFDTENQLNQLELFPYHDYPLNQVRGEHHNIISFMSDMHPVRNLSEAEDFIKRTDLAIEVYSGLYDWLQRQADSGIFAPKFVYAHIIEQLGELINYSYEEHPLYTQFIKKIKLLDLADEEFNSLESSIKNSIQESVTPGFVLLREFMLQNLFMHI